MTWKPVAAALIALSLTGCSVYREATGTRTPATTEWRRIVTDADRERLRVWRKTWDEALAKASAADPKSIAALPMLFDPDRALANPAPPPGNYRCQVYKLGAAGTAMHDFTVYPSADCRIEDEGEVLSLHKLTGSQRPTGLLFPDSPTRLIFLGTLVLGDETAPLRYGTDATRDMVGYVERVAPRRWRLVFPSPRFESLLDVIELVPAK